MFILEQKLGASVLRTTPIEFVLTVPAIWSELAKQQTLKACKKAGLTTKKQISLVSEPVSYSGTLLGNSLIIRTALDYQDRS